ncbi:hypothetical protein [Croceicoccus bisphenolivorans]|uniref:hypothetical protein n=1 Tax=Croceicoccus bisphenolivorans TaxID=1783232 RepID=UPI000AEE329B|nr:hypothetical protein [Croceicoccus bisphenolivorans]
MNIRISRSAIGALALTFSSGAVTALPAFAQQSAPGVSSESVPVMAFSDLADLATAAPMVAIVEVKKASRLDPERTGPVKAGWARAYVEAETKTLLAGKAAIGGKVKYLADIKLDARGKMPRIRKQTMVVFARPVAGRVDELQLVAPDAQVPLAYAGEARVRALLAEIVSADAAPEVTGVRDAYHTPGNLAGEGETQIFLKTANGDPASIAVVRRPNGPPRWGLSTGELVDIEATPPAPNTLAWYRLACALPAQLPASAQIATDPSLRQAAARDYALVVQQLGQCGRQRVF